MTEVRIPASDAVEPMRLLALGGAMLALGLGLAWAGMSEAGGGAAPRDSALGETARAEAATDEEPADETPADETPADEAPADEAPADEAPADEAPADEAPADEEPADEAPADEAPADEAPADGESHDEAPADEAPSGPLRFVRGRVAILRCDGPQPCPRDESLEDAIWAHLATLPDCASRPAAAGQADVRLDYVGATSPTVRIRDTFADDVVRLDGEAVLGCVAEPLRETRSSIGAARLLLSFRFSLAER